ncbi:AAA family ATPase [Lentzea flaviverrucosa]|uniref:Pilus assembly protein CpaE n=1 Tax=Lentzea flaviverrucosa TaxID=200379 RepID=A0A1H9MV56_9PSEU|nr:AAA family ATPase [Lentzea flaviverrucosa]RDI30776.1 pilus assembly protein CpaE [Lentzea flaviverrucosa]SER27359.1 pilus assembly protein CpaE [Lentzea flaviverrucosa]
MTILCEPAALAGQLSPALGGDLRTAATLGEASRLLAADPLENLVVIGSAVGLDEALAFTAGLRVERPAAGVVLLRDVLDVAVLTRALRAGVREVVARDDLAALVDACTRSRALSSQVAGVPMPRTDERRNGQVLTVFAAKGGCGKTTLAVNLAASLAAGGERSVCLVDLDLSFGDVGICLRAEPVRTIVHGLGMVGHVDAAGASSLLTACRPGLSALLAPVEPGDAERIPAALVGELLDVLPRMFDFVVVDTPSAFSEHVLAAMDASHHHVLLTTPDVPALKNLRVTLDMLDLLSYAHDIRSVVLNRSDAKVGLSMDDIDRVVRSEIRAHVPSSRDVPISVNKGNPIVLDLPRHPVSEAISRFAREHVLAEPVAAARPSKRWFR